MKKIYLTNTISKTTILFALIISSNAYGQAQALKQEQILDVAPKVQSNYNGEIITILLEAEMAIDRNMYDLALKNYIKATEISKDPEIAREATQLAIELEKGEEAITAAKIWADSAPLEIQPQIVCVTLLIGTDVQATIPYLERAFDIMPENFDEHLSAIQSRLSKVSSKHFSEALEQIALKKNQNPIAQLSAAQALAQEGNIKSAKQFVDNTLKLKPELTSAIKLKAKLIRYESSDEKKALAFLQEQVNIHKENADLKMFYASALIDNNLFEDAIKQLNSIVKDKTFGGEALIFLSEIYLSSSNLIKAAETLAKAIDFPNQKNTARFLLGQINEQEGNVQEAIKNYSNVSAGNYHINAYLRAALLLSENNKYTDAIELLHDASPTTFTDQKQLILTEMDIHIESGSLEKAFNVASDVIEVVNDDPDFLFARGIIASQLKKTDIAINDLLKTVKLQPNNAQALNALGFTITTQTKKHSEAKIYIERALKIKPNTPAFLDSLAWVNFNMGKHADAINLLKQAMQISQDSEIAAHLGEVLWSTGQKSDALKIWQNAYIKTPSHAILLDTLKKFKIDPSKFSEPEKKSAKL